MKMIQCMNLVKSFGQPPLVILKSLSLDIDHGDFVAVTGRSGSGKSTLLYVVSGLDELNSGEVRISEKNIHRLGKRELHQFRNLRMGFVFQFHYLLAELTALENILMPARKFGRERERREYADALMEQFEVMHCRDKRPSQMSGGEMQRTAIARALIMEPEILFADEPTGNLDSENGGRVMSIFENINDMLGTTILMVTHEEDYAARANRQIHLVDGMIDRDTRRQKKSGAAKR